MRVLIQRVSQAAIDIDGDRVAKVADGLLVLVCFDPADTEATVDRMVERLLNYRVFSDEQGKMNRSLRDIDGELLLVSQFTLAADTSKGNRPSFSKAGDPESGRRLFGYLVDKAKREYRHIQSGRFAAHMRVSLVNDGPVTLLLTM